MKPLGYTNFKAISVYFTLCFYAQVIMHLHWSLFAENEMYVTLKGKGSFRSQKSLLFSKLWPAFFAFN